VISKVLMHPEFYLYAAYVVLTVGSFLTSVLLAVYVYRKTNDGVAALLVQLPGLCFLTWPSINAAYPVLPVAANVSPEGLFMGVMNLFNLFFLRLYFARGPHKEIGKVLWLAFGCGLGLAAKINFFPVLFSALIVVSWRRKLLFILACGAFFIFWTLPIITKYCMVWDQIKQASLYSSRYGWGGATVIDWPSYIKYFKYTFHDYWFFVLLALFLFLWSLMRFIKDNSNREAKFLAAASMGGLLQFMIIAKYFSFHYLVPGMGLFSSIFLLFYLALKDRYKRLKPFFAAFICLFALVSISLAFLCHHRLSDFTHDILTIKDRVHQNYPKCAILPTWTSDVNLYLSQEHALFMGNAVSYYKESDNLSRLYPHFYYFFSEEVSNSLVDYGIWNFKKRIFADEILNTCPCSIFLKYGHDLSGYPFQTRLIDHSKYLNAYLLTGSTERQANDLFLDAQMFYNNHDYKKAFAYALKSRQLNYKPSGEVEYFLATLYNQLHEK